MIIISSHVTPPLRPLMARIVPPAGHGRFCLQCVCALVKETERQGPCQRATGNVTADGPAHGPSAVGGFVRVWGLCTSRKAKVLLKWDRSSRSSVGSKEEETEEQQLYNFIYATHYLLSHPSYCQVTAAHCDPRGKHTHIHTSSLNLKTLFKAVLSVAVSCPSPLNTKKKLEDVTESGSGCLKRTHSNK